MSNKENILGKEIETHKQSKNINKVGYWAFVVAGLYFTFFSDDKSNGTMFLALAFVFEPFDAKVAFPDRTLLQKTWLIGHLIVVLISFLYLIFS